jgi:hypothetical protein
MHFTPIRHTRPVYLFLLDFLSFPLKVLDRPLGLQEVDAPRIPRQLAHEGGKVVTLAASVV